MVNKRDKQHKPYKLYVIIELEGSYGNKKDVDRFLKKQITLTGKIRTFFVKRKGKWAVKLNLS